MLPKHLGSHVFLRASRAGRLSTLDTVTLLNISQNTLIRHVRKRKDDGHMDSGARNLT